MIIVLYIQTNFIKLHKLSLLFFCLLYGFQLGFDPAGVLYQGADYAVDGQERPEHWVLIECGEPSLKRSSVFIPFGRSKQAAPYVTELAFTAFAEAVLHLMIRCAVCSGAGNVAQHFLLRRR